MNLDRYRSALYDSKRIAMVILAAVFTFKFSFIVWQFAENHFIIAPGGDPINHLGYILHILRGEPTAGLYPPLYHYLIAILSKVFNADPLLVMKPVAIILLFAPIIVLYKMTKTFFGFWPAFWATLLYMVAAASPLLSFGDGNYPDMLNYGIFVPLVFIYLLKTLREKSTNNILFFLVFVALMIFTHHLTTLFTLVIIAVYIITIGLLVYFKKDSFKHQFPNLSNTALAFIGLTVVGFLLVRATFGQDLMSALRSLFSNGSFINNNSLSSPIGYDQFAYTLTPFIEFAGAFGLIYALATIKDKTPQKLLLIVWVIVLWVLSRTQLSGLAPRYFRELSVPLCVMAGIFIDYLLSHAENGTQRIAFGGMIGFLMYTNMVQVNLPPFLISQGGFKNMVWYRSADREKVDFIKSELPRNVVVLSTPSNPYIPYFLSKDNPNNIQFIVADSIPIIPKDASKKLKRDIITSYVVEHNASYILLGGLPGEGLNEKEYGEFRGYKAASEFLGQFEHSDREVIKTFSDGSQLIMVNE